MFEIAKTASGYASTPTILFNFDTTHGANPYGNLIIDAAGNLFGTTAQGGNVGNGPGTVFELPKTPDGYASTPTILALVGNPEGGLIVDSSGDLFGTTAQGGSLYDGSVFEITDSGFVVACFAAGTRIATARGDLEVEKLSAGDQVVSVFGGAVPVVWIGHRSIDCCRHPRPQDVLPVRVRAHAFAPGRPARDLLLSPDHAVYVDGALIPVRHLVNGASIAREAVNDITYYHVELPVHDVLLAEGLPAESYLDTGNRSAFANNEGTAAAHPDFAVVQPQLIEMRQRHLLVLHHGTPERKPT